MLLAQGIKAVKLKKKPPPQRLKELELGAKLKYIYVLYNAWNLKRKMIGNNRGLSIHAANLRTDVWYVLPSPVWIFSRLLNVVLLLLVWHSRLITPLASVCWIELDVLRDTVDSTVWTNTDGLYAKINQPMRLAMCSIAIIKIITIHVSRSAGSKYVMQKSILALWETAILFFFYRFKPQGGWRQVFFLSFHL